MPRFGFTEHAIDRFIERHAPDLSRAQARSYLEEAVLKAVRLKEKTHNGEAQWQIEDGTVLVTKVDRREVVCVTVLPGPRHHGGPSEEEMDLMREHASRPAPPPEMDLGSACTFLESALSDTQLKRLLHLGQLEAARTRQKEKTKRHLDHQSSEIAKLKTMLKAAMAGLESLDGGAPYLDEMKAIEKNFDAHREVRKAS